MRLLLTVKHSWKFRTSGNMTLNIQWRKESTFMQCTHGMEMKRLKTWPLLNANYSVPITTDVKVIYQESYLRFWSKLFSMEIKNFNKTRGKFLLEIKREIFPFKMKWIPWAAVQNINEVLKLSRLLATSLEILVANTQFSVTLATSWSQFWTTLYWFVFWMWLIG